MYNVRQARLSDVPKLLLYCEKFFKELPIPFPYDPVHMADVVEHIVKNQVALVVEHGGKVVGTIGGSVVPHPFSLKTTTLVEHMWWVDPEYRNTRAGLMLLCGFEKVGKDIGAMVVLTIQAAGSISDKVLLKHGFVKQETTYIKGV